MASNSTCPVNITSLSDVLKLVAEIHPIYEIVNENNTIGGIDLNATYGPVLLQCPDICDAIMGTGNPDLTGIGLFAHYCIQAALTVLFGNWIYYFRAELNQRTPRLFSTLANLQETFVDFNAYAVFIIALTALVRTYQHPSIFETNILPILVEFETWMLMLNLISRVSLQVSSAEPAGDKVLLYIAFLAFAAACNVVLGYWVDELGDVLFLVDYCSGTSALFDDLSDADVLTQLYTAQNYLLWPPAVVVMWLVVQSCPWITTTASKVMARFELRFPPLRAKKSFATAKRAWSFLHYVSALLLVYCFLSPLDYLLSNSSDSWVNVFSGEQTFWAIVCLYVATAIFGCVVGRCLLSRPVQRWSSKMSKRIRHWNSKAAFKRSIQYTKMTGPIAWLIPSAFFFIVNPTFHLRNIQYYRHVMQENMGTLYADDQWGVGQVAALLAWMPLLVATIAQLHALCFPTPEHDKSKSISDDPVHHGDRHTAECKSLATRPLGSHAGDSGSNPVTTSFLPVASSKPASSQSTSATLCNCSGVLESPIAYSSLSAVVSLPAIHVNRTSNKTLRSKD